MSPKTTAIIFIGTVGGGGVFYAYNQLKEDTITKDDIVISTLTKSTSSPEHKGITCTQTKTITIKKLPDTKYYLCDTVTDTNTTYTQITKASMVLPKNITFATEAGSHHTIMEGMPKQNIDQQPSFYGFNSNSYVRTVDKNIFFIHSPIHKNDEYIKDMIVKISGFKNENNHTPTYTKLQQLLYLFNKIGKTNGTVEIQKNVNDTVENGTQQQISDMITALKAAYTHAATTIPKLEEGIRKNNKTLTPNKSIEPMIILESRVKQLDEIIKSNVSTSALDESTKTKLTKYHNELKKFIEKGSAIEIDAQIFIKQMVELLRQIKQNQATPTVTKTVTN